MTMVLGRDWPLKLLSAAAVTLAVGLLVMRL